MGKLKKLLALVLAVMLLLLPTGCKDKQNEEDVEKEPFDAEQVLEQLKVEGYALEEYTTYKDAVVLLVENASIFGLDIHCKLTTYDEDGYVIDVCNEKQRAVAGGIETIFLFDYLEKFSSYDYELTVEEAPKEGIVIDQLSYDIAEGKEHFTVNVKNGSGETADEVRGYMLYFNGDSLVDCVMNGHVSVDLVGLYAGESESAQYMKPKDSNRNLLPYSSYKFILTGFYDPYL